MDASVPLDSTESVLSDLSTVFFEKLIVYSLPEHRERLSKTDPLFAEMIQKVRDLAVKVEIIAEVDSTGDWFHPNCYLDAWGRDREVKCFARKYSKQQFPLPLAQFSKLVDGLDGNGKEFSGFARRSIHFENSIGISLLHHSNEKSMSFFTECAKAKNQGSIQVMRVVDDSEKTEYFIPGVKYKFEVGKGHQRTWELCIDGKGKPFAAAVTSQKIFKPERDFFERVKKIPDANQSTFFLTPVFMQELYKTQILVIAPLCRGDLVDWYERRPDDYHTNVRLMLGVIKGLTTLHGTLNCSHRDLKWDNILVIRDDKGEWIAKISDFGSIGPLRGQLSGGYCVTPSWLNFEVASVLYSRNTVANVDFQALDLFAMGHLLFYAFSGSVSPILITMQKLTPNDQLDRKQFKKYIQSKPLETLPVLNAEKYKEGLQREVIDLLQMVYAHSNHSKTETQSVQNTLEGILNRISKEQLVELAEVIKKNNRENLTQSLG